MRKLFLILLPIFALSILVGVFLKMQKEIVTPSQPTTPKNALITRPSSNDSKTEMILPSTDRAYPSNNENSKEILISKVLISGSARSDFSRIVHSISNFYRGLRDKEERESSIEGRFSLEAFEKSYKQKLSEKLTIEELTRLEELNRQNEVQDYIQAQESFLSDEGRKNANEAFLYYETNPPNPERFQLLQELDDTLHISEYNAATMTALNAAMVELTKKGAPTQLRPEIFKQSAMVQLATSLADKSDQEIQALVQVFAVSAKQKELALRWETIVETIQTLNK